MYTPRERLQSAAASRGIRWSPQMDASARAKEPREGYAKGRRMQREVARVAVRRRLTYPVPEL